MSLRPLNKVVASPSAFDSLNNYIGESDFPGWDCLLTQNRDSDCLARSNFRSALKALGGESDNVAVHEFGHWACGWWKALAVKQGTPEHATAIEIADRLEDYPVVDENDFSNLEDEEAHEIWKNCYRPKERLEYIREHRNQFDFRDYRDLLECARGKFFCGYACDLLG